MAGQKKSRKHLEKLLQTKQPSGKLIEFCLKFDCIRIFVGLLQWLDLTNLPFYPFFETIPADQDKFSLQDKDKEILKSSLHEWYLNCLRFSKKNPVESLDIHSVTLGYLKNIMKTINDATDTSNQKPLTKKLKLKIANPFVFLYGEGGFGEMISELD